MAIDTIGIVGAGTMGCGIAAALNAPKRRILVFEQDPVFRTSALDRIASAGLGDATDPGAIELVEALDDLAPCDLVIEAINEDLDAKHVLYAPLFAATKPDAIVASNTSSIMPDRLAAQLTDEQAQRFLVAHFWNPPQSLPLVELVGSERTNTASMEKVEQLLIVAGLKPVRLAHAVPGFIGNRLQFALLREALHLIEAGVADPATIDEVVRHSLGPRYAVTGPIESADLGGLHVMLAVAEQLMPNLAAGLEGIDTLKAKVTAGNVGARSGCGFYNWTPNDLAAVQHRREMIRKCG